MGKRRSRVEKMKLSSKKSAAGATLLNMEESDSDVQEFVLPKRKIIKPGRNARRRLGGCCRTCASVFLSLILIASILCVLVLGWFSLRLKRDLNALHNRLSEVESYDRSSNREYTTLRKDVINKITGLRDEEAKKSMTDDEHYKSLVAQITFLNTTLKAISLKANSPKSVVSISKDIDQLKKGMADTGQEITAVKDTVIKLTKLAHLQNGMLSSLRHQLYNLSREVARITGKPSPRAPVTGTPPIILQMPVDEPSKTTSSESHQHSTSQLHNVSIITDEIKQVIKIVKKINGSFVGEAERLKKDLTGMKNAFEKHTVQYVALEKEVKGLTANLPHPTAGANSSDKHTTPPPNVSSTADVQLGSRVRNLTRTVKKIADFLLSHQKKFSKVERDVAKMNKTVYRHHVRLEPQSRATSICNCTTDSGAVKKLWLNMSYEHQHLVSLQSKLVKLEHLTLKYIKVSKGQSPSDERIMSIKRIYPTSHTAEGEKQSGKKDLSEQDIRVDISAGTHGLNTSDPEVGPVTQKSGQPTPTSNHTVLTTDTGEKSDLNSTVSSSVATPKPTSSATLDEEERELESKLNSKR